MRPRNVSIQLVTPVLRSRFLLPAARLIALLVLAVPTLHIYIIPLTAAQAAPASPMQVSIEQGLLTVEAREAPLADLLHMIGEQAGLRVTIHGNVKTLVTDSFAGLSLGEGIRRVVGANGLVLIYTPSRGEAGASLLTEVRVYHSPPAATMSKGTDPKKPAEATRPRDSDRATRLKAIQELARRRDEAAIAALVQILAQDEDPIVRAQAALALATIGGAQAAGALTTALEDQDPSVRIEAARAFAGVEGERAIPALGDVLMGDPDPHVRMGAARALSLLQSEEAQLALEAAISENSDVSVLRTITSALARREPEKPPLPPH